MLAQFLGQVGKMGSNINQMTKLAHTGVIPSETAILSTLDEVILLRKDLRKAMGREDGP